MIREIPSGEKKKKKKKRKGTRPMLIISHSVLIFISIWSTLIDHNDYRPHRLPTMIFRS